MGIAKFIQDQLLKKLQPDRGRQVECLVVYDPEQRYHEICIGLGNEEIVVVDTSESSIESREKAQRAFHKLADYHLADGKIRGLLIYIPKQVPITDDERKIDPFSTYAKCGAQFPAEDGDEYFNLCLKFKHEYSTEIRRLFRDNPAPSFAVIDAVGGGLNFPQLRATFKAESSIDVLTGLLVPTDAQQQAIKTQEGWVTEVREFLKTTIDSP